MILIELNKWVIYEINETKPLDMKIVDEELLFFIGLYRILVDYPHSTSDFDSSFFCSDFLPISFTILM